MQLKSWMIDLQATMLCDMEHLCYSAVIENNATREEQWDQTVIISISFQ
jgi:hypothetical protein